MALNFKLEIITPEKTIFSSEVDHVTIPSYEGEMTILKDHISLVTFLRPGIIKIGEKDLENFYLDDGIVEFSNNILLILSSTAQELSKIDKNSLKNLIDDAEKKVKNENFSDKERYLLSYKVQTLKTLNQ